MRAMRISIGHVAIVLALSACASAEQDGRSKRREPANEIVSGGASIRGGGIRMDVQVGRPFVQRPTRTPEATAKPGAVVTQ
jgi:hypothetical protein